MSLKRTSPGDTTNAEIKVDHDRVSDEGVGLGAGGLVFDEVASWRGITSEKKWKDANPIVKMPSNWLGCKEKI